MKLIEPAYDILTPISEGGIKELTFIENVARTCYKSDANNEGDFEKTKRFIKSLIKNGHEAMLEHSFLSVRFTCDRGVSHELVRHRLMSFAQESTRYCNYTNAKYGGVTFIKPYWYDDAPHNAKLIFEDMCSASENAYDYIVKTGEMPQGGRSVLPNSLKTEIVVSGNYRNWRHLLNLRAANSTGKAHPDMNLLMQPLLDELHDKIPVIFDDVYERMVKNGNLS